jgi:hypothetical protein
LLIGLTLAVCLVGVAAAQTRYAPPTLSKVDEGLFRITLGITAGANGSPAGFTVQWMKKSDYDALGGWAADGDPRLKYCQCYGPYVLNQWAGSAIMGPGETSYLQLGDLADEDPSALYGNEYGPLGNPNGPPYRSWEYVVRAFTEGDGYGDASDFSSTLNVQTMASECTQGFWKNHGAGACHSGNNADVWPASCFTPNMTLGTVQYTKTQICSILQQNVGGNGLISLAHQLITAILNGCNNSSYPPSVAAAIANAHALIGGLVIPPVGGGSLNPGTTSSTTETLDDYNNGLLGGVKDCPTPVRANSTWGRIKVLYR